MPLRNGRHTSSTAAGTAPRRRSGGCHAEPLEQRRMLSGAPPALASLAADPAFLAPGEPFALRCGDVSDPDNDPVTVRFYRESNGVPGLQVSTTNNRPPDLLLGSNPTGEYTLALKAPQTTGVVRYTFYAVADDGTSLSDVASAAQTVAQPQLKALAPVAYAGDVLTLVTCGVLPGESATGVSFYQESNGRPGCQPGDDTHLGIDRFADNPGADLPEYSVSLVPGGTTPESRTYYAFTFDVPHLPLAAPLTLSHPFGGVPAAPADPFEPNGPADTAPYVVFASTHELDGLSAWAGDEDWYLITFIAPSRFEAELTSPDLAARGDMTVELYDSGRALVARSPAPDASADAPRVISAPLEAYRHYYLRVHSPSHDARPQYGLRLKRTGPAAVDFKYVAYKNSALDGYDATPGAVADASIARDKGFLSADDASHTPIPQQVSSYARGINAIVIDVLGLPPAVAGREELCAGDFEFRAGTGGDSSAWPLAPAPTGVSVRRGAGAGRTDRVAVTFADGAIANRWLRVTMKSTANTGLPAPDVFFYGNLVGETGAAAAPEPAYPPLRVDRADLLNVRRNFARSAGHTPATDPCDHNRDGAVNGADLLLTARNLGRTLDAIKLPAAGTASAAVAPAAAPPQTLRARPPIRASLFGERQVLA